MTDFSALPTLPPGCRWQVEVAGPGQRAEVTVKIVYWWFQTMAKQSVYTWPNQTREELQATVLTAATRACDTWAAELRGNTLQDWAFEIEQRLNGA